MFIFLILAVLLSTTVQAKDTVPQVLLAQDNPTTCEISCYKSRKLFIKQGMSPTIAARYYLNCVQKCVKTHKEQANTYQPSSAAKALSALKR